MKIIGYVALAAAVVYTGGAAAGYWGGGTAGTAGMAGSTVGSTAGGSGMLGAGAGGSMVNPGTLALTSSGNVALMPSTFGAGSMLGATAAPLSSALAGGANYAGVGATGGLGGASVIPASYAAPTAMGGNLGVNAAGNIINTSLPVSQTTNPGTIWK